MNIGIDIDGTITTAFYWLDYYNQHFKTNIQPSQVTTYDHHLALGVSLNEYSTFRKKHIHTIHNLAKPRIQSGYFLRKLFFENHHLSVITAREKELESLTSQWLSKYQMYYHALYHLGHTNKASLALQLNLDLFLEDRLETALEIVKHNIPVILFDTPYNQHDHHPLIYRVYHWVEVYEVIDHLKGCMETSSTKNKKEVIL